MASFPHARAIMLIAAASAAPHVAASPTCIDCGPSAVYSLTSGDVVGETYTADASAFAGQRQFLGIPFGAYMPTPPTHPHPPTPTHTHPDNHVPPSVPLSHPSSCPTCGGLSMAAAATARAMDWGEASDELHAKLPSTFRNVDWRRKLPVPECVCSTSRGVQR